MVDVVQSHATPYTLQKCIRLLFRKQSSLSAMHERQLHKEIVL